MTSVLLVAERDDQGEISQSTLQAVTAARGLADVYVTAVITGDADGSASTLGAVDKVVTISAVDSGDVGIYEQVTADLAALISSTSPDVVILGKSDFGSIVGCFYRGCGRWRCSCRCF